MKSMARLAFCQLAIFGLVVAGRFDILARTTSLSSSTSSSSSSPTLSPSPSPSQSSNSSVPNTTSFSSSATLSLSGNASDATNATITTTTGNNTSSSGTSTLSSPTSAPTNDAQAADAAEACHRDDSKEDSSNASPFCFPVNNVKVYVKNTTYFVWDRKRYRENATYEIQLRYADYVTKNDTISHVNANITQGWAKIEMEQDWLHGNKSTNLTFFLNSIAQTDSQANTTTSGTQFTLVDPNSEKDDDSSSSKKDKKIGIGLGIPIAFAFIALGIAGIFFYMRRRRRAGGYLAKRSLSHGSVRDRAIHSEDDDWNGGTRGSERFRDEPGPGLELQDRSRGHRRGDSLGSLESSPTHDGFESQGQSGGNAFRDEISRQRGKNR